VRHLGREHPDIYEKVVKDMDERRKPGAAKMTFDWDSGSFVPSRSKERKNLKRGRPRLHGPEDEKSRTCQDCGKVFVRRKNMEIHRDAVHNGLRPFSCNECGKSFARKEGNKYSKKSLM